MDDLVGEGGFVIASMLLGVVAAFAVLGAGAMAAAGRRSSHGDSRLAELLAGRPDSSSSLVPPLLSRNVFGRLGRFVRRRLGRVGDPILDRRVGHQVAAGLVGALISLPVGLAVIVGWSAVPVLQRRTAARRLERRLVNELPDVIDLFRLAITAGLNVRLAVESVVDHGSGALVAELALVLARVERGMRLAEALESIGVLGAPVRPLLDALLASERYGAPIDRGLARAGVEARMLRRRRGEEAARRVPVKMLFPLVLCTLPALGLLTVVPLLARSLPSIAT